MPAETSTGASTAPPAGRLFARPSTARLSDGQMMPEARPRRVGIGHRGETRDGVGENELIVANTRTSARSGDHVKPKLAAEARRLGTQ